MKNFTKYLDHFSEYSKSDFEANGLKAEFKNFGIYEILFAFCKLNFNDTQGAIEKSTEGIKHLSTFIETKDNISDKTLSMLGLGYLIRGLAIAIKTNSDQGCGDLRKVLDYGRTEAADLLKGCK